MAESRPFLVATYLPTPANLEVGDIAGSPCSGPGGKVQTRAVSSFRFLPLWESR